MNIFCKLIRFPLKVMISKRNILKVVWLKKRLYRKKLKKKIQRRKKIGMKTIMKMTKNKSKYNLNLQKYTISMNFSIYQMKIN